MQWKFHRNISANWVKSHTKSSCDLFTQILRFSFATCKDFLVLMCCVLFDALSCFFFPLVIQCYVTKGTTLRTQPKNVKVAQLKLLKGLPSGCHGALPPSAPLPTFIHFISLGLKKVMCPSVLSTSSTSRHANTTQPRMLILLRPGQHTDTCVYAHTVYCTHTVQGSHTHTTRLRFFHTNWGEWHWGCNREGK